MSGHTTVPLIVYRIIVAVAGPYMQYRVGNRLKSFGVSEIRRQEREGYPSEMRPDGQLVWLHAASVGESLSTLPLIEALHAADPQLRILLTTGTASSAEILARRLPTHVQHQFAPLDRPNAVERFLRHWRPQLAMFVESEIWPQMLLQTEALNIPVALINTRFSKKTRRHWRRIKHTLDRLVGRAELLHAQDTATATFLHGITGQTVLDGPNLKSLAAAPPVDEIELERMRASIRDRAVWLAALTHHGEDEIILAAHELVRESIPGALLILVPRHPERAPEIKEMVQGRGMEFSQRSLNQRISNDTSVYIADSLGEMGLWYALSPVTFLAGSLGNAGGHNAWEPASIGTALVSGPNFENAKASYNKLDLENCVSFATDAKEISSKILTLLEDSELTNHIAEKQRSLVAAERHDGLAKLTRRIQEILL